MNERIDSAPESEARGVSRRDFLRRAGNEAATTASMLPGVGAAVRATGLAQPSSVAAPTAPQAWWQRLLRRRARVQASTEASDNNG